MLENDNLEKHFMEVGKMKFMHCFEVIFFRSNITI